VSASTATVQLLTGSWLTVEELGFTSEERREYSWRFTPVDGIEITSSESDSIQLGVGAPSDPAEALRALCSFILAALESVAYGERYGTPGENAELFPADMLAQLDSDDVQLASLELEVSE
jgi:hypothetical protein